MFRRKTAPATPHRSLSSLSSSSRSMGGSPLPDVSPKRRASKSSRASGEVSELQSINDALQSEIKRLREIVDSQSGDQVRALQREIRELFDENKELHRQVAELQGRLDATQARLRDLVQAQGHDADLRGLVAAGGSMFPKAQDGNQKWFAFALVALAHAREAMLAVGSGQLDASLAGEDVAFAEANQPSGAGRDQGEEEGEGGKERPDKVPNNDDDAAGSLESRARALARLSRRLREDAAQPLAVAQRRWLKELGVLRGGLEQAELQRVRQHVAGLKRATSTGACARGTPPLGPCAQHPTVPHLDSSSLEYLALLFATAATVRPALESEVAAWVRGLEGATVKVASELLPVETVLHAAVAHHAGDFSKVTGLLRAHVECERLSTVADLLRRLQFRYGSLGDDDDNNNRPQQPGTAGGSPSKGSVVRAVDVTPRAPVAAKPGASAPVRVVAVCDELTEIFPSSLCGAGTIVVRAMLFPWTSPLSFSDPPTDKEGVPSLVCEVVVQLRAMGAVVAARGIPRAIDQCSHALRLSRAHRAEEILVGGSEGLQGAVARIASGQCRAVGAVGVELDAASLGNLAAALASPASAVDALRLVECGLGKEDLRGVIARRQVPNLECVDLSGNPGLDIADVAALVGWTLRSLHLRQCGLDGAMSARLCGVIVRERAEQLQELDLRGNGIEQPESFLFDALGVLETHCPNLQRLRLGGNKTGDQGVVALSSWLGGLQCLVELDVSHMGFGVAGATALAAAMERLVCLQELDASGNNLGVEGVHAIRGAVPKLNDLLSIRLVDCGADERALAELRDSAQGAQITG